MRYSIVLQFLRKPQVVGLLLIVVVVMIGYALSVVRISFHASEQFGQTQSSVYSLRLSDHDSTGKLLPNDLNDSTEPDYTSSSVPILRVDRTGKIQNLFRLEGIVVFKQR